MVRNGVEGSAMGGTGNSPGARHPHEPSGSPIRAALRNPRLGLELLLDRFAIDRLRSFFFRTLEYQHRLGRDGTAPYGSYYEFGVGWGGTLSKYLSALRAFSRAYSVDTSGYRSIAFDSFEGLPASSDPRDVHPMWRPGDFSHSQLEVSRRLRSLGLPDGPPTVTFVPGRFAESLTPQLRDELAAAPPSLVTVDVDYYSSTRTVLRWIRPMLSDGTIFYFDDIWSFHGDREKGELAAIAEFNAEGPGRLNDFPLLGMPSQVYILSGAGARPNTSPANLSHGVP